MARKRIAKMISNEKDIDYIANITEDDITTTFISEMFGEINGKRRFNPYDEIIIPEKCYGIDKYRNKNKIHTTVGIYIFNKYFIERDLIKILGYINENIDKNKLGDINDILSYSLLEDKITTKQLERYLLKTQKFMPFSNILSPTITIDMLTSTEKINKKKEELIKKYKKELDQHDVGIVQIMQDELLDYAKEILKDDPSMDLFNSGCRGNFGNNFKDMFVMKGAIANPDPNSEFDYNIAMSNYMSGFGPDEYAILADSLANGPYSRGKKTEVGGYWEKLVRDAYQHIVLLPAGSDCHTEGYITETLTEKSVKDFMYNFIIDGDKLVEITSDNKDKYLGKPVKIRFPNMCIAEDGICNVCMGNLYYRIGDMKNVGISLTAIPAVLKNKAMKLFHDSQVKLREMDPMEAFSIKK